MLQIVHAARYMVDIAYCMLHAACCVVHDDRMRSYGDGNPDTVSDSRTNTQCFLKKAQTPKVHEIEQRLGEVACNVQRTACNSTCI